MSFNYTKNGGKKAFPAKPKHQYHVSQWDDQDCSASNKKNGDYCKYPSLYHFIDQLWLLGKWLKEKLFLANPMHQYHESQSEVNMIAVPNNQKIGDYYEYLVLSYFID